MYCEDCDPRESSLSLSLRVQRYIYPSEVFWVGGICLNQFWDRLKCFEGFRTVLFYSFTFCRLVYRQWWALAVPSLRLVAGLCWLRWAPAPFCVLLLFLFVVWVAWSLRGSIRISDRGKGISTQRLALVICCFCFFPLCRVQFFREIFRSLFIFIYFSHIGPSLWAE